MDQKAKVSTLSVNYGSRNITTPSTVYREDKIHIHDIDRTIGVKLLESDLITLANRMGYRGSKYGDYLLVYIPPYRLDYINSQDVVEDIAIAFGYNNITPIPVMGGAIGTTNVLTDLTTKIQSTMVGLGFDEAINNYITNDDMQFEKMGKKRLDEETIRIAYSKTASLTSMRQTITPSLLSNLSISQHERMPIKLFESGSVFKVADRNAIEGFAVSFVLESSTANFSEAKSYAEALISNLGLKASIKPAEEPHMIAGRCAGIFVKGKRIGSFGEIHPAVLKEFGIAEPVVSCEVLLLEEIDYYKE